MTLHRHRYVMRLSVTSNMTELRHNVTVISWQYAIISALYNDAQSPRHSFNTSPDISLNTLRLGRIYENGNDTIGL